MFRKGIKRNLMVVLLLGMSTLIPSPGEETEAVAKPIQACVTVPDLGSLLKEVGGDTVSVTTFAKSKEDPHFVEAKPSFIKALSQADFYVQIGMDLEVGWAPVLLQNARNGRVLPGNPGYLDASSVVAPLEIPTGPVDRSMGDVHPLGNPHYLTDPLNGLKVARLIRDRLAELRPERKSFFDERLSLFNQRATAALAGEKLSRKYDLERLSLLFEQGKLGPFLKEKNEENLLGGWYGMMLPYFGTKVVSDHNVWPYFSKRFGISVVDFLEPKPGLSPTTKHLQSLVEKMRADGIKVILAVPYFDLRHARFAAKNAGAKIVPLAHQAGAYPGTDDYLRMIDYNVKQVAGALGGRS